MGSSRRRAFLNWLPAALAVLMITLESTVFMSAANTSRWLLPVWERLFGPITPHRWSIVNESIRKTGHFTGYGLVSVCFFHGFRTTLRSIEGLRGLWVRSAIFALGCTILIASADELHQGFLPNRGGSPWDVGLDTCGAIIALLIILFLMSRLSRKPAASFSGSFAK
jgi:VanZ family protein